MDFKLLPLEKRCSVVSVAGTGMTAYTPTHALKKEVDELEETESMGLT